MRNRYRKRLLGTASRLIPGLILARGVLTGPLHDGVLDDLHSTLAYELAACSGRREFAAADAAARRIVDLFTADEYTARFRAEAMLAQEREEGVVGLVAAAVLSNLEWAAGNLAEGLRLGGEAVRRVDSAVPAAWRAYPALALSAKRADLGEPAEAETLVRAAQREVAGRGGGPAAADVAIARSRLLLNAGRLTLAREAAHAGLALAGRLGADWAVPEALSLLCVLELRVGDRTAASDLIWRCLMHLDREDAVFGSVRFCWARFLVCASRLDQAKAAHLLAAQYGHLPVSPLLFVEDPAAAPWLVRLARAADDAPLAMTVVDAVERLAAAHPEHPGLGVAAVHARGLWEQDVAVLQNAADEHRDPWAAALAWEDIGTLLCRRDGALSLDGPRKLRAALVRFTDIGAQADAERVHDGLLAAAAPAPGTAAGADAAGTAAGGRPLAPVSRLTAVERDVMELVAEGLTNRQVARRLMRSPHTVNYHLRQIFRKLGVGSRVELARMCSVMEQL